MKTASWADTANGVVVTLVGEIDFATAGDLIGVIGEIFSQRRPAEVRVDVRAMPFIDSTGLSALISLYRAALAADARLVLVDPAPFLVTLLGITGLVELFPVESSEAGAAPASVPPHGAAPASVPPYGAAPASVPPHGVLRPAPPGETDPGVALPGAVPGPEPLV